MKRKWSREWISSKQPRKQRKYRHNAPLHVRHRFVSAHLSSELRKQFKKRSLPVRKGDEVEIMKGISKGMRGSVDRVDLKRCKVYVDGVNIKKVDGSEVLKAIEPSNLKIIKLKLDDKKRQMIFERAEKSEKANAEKKQPVKKMEHKKQKKTRKTKEHRKTRRIKRRSKRMSKKKRKGGK